MIEKKIREWKVNVFNENSNSSIKKKKWEGKKKKEKSRFPLFFYLLAQFVYSVERNYF